MRNVKWVLSCLSFLVAGSLSGCAGLPTEVADVMADKGSYLNNEFTADKLPDEVRKQFSGAGAVSFKTMVVTSVPVMEDRPKDQPVPDLKTPPPCRMRGAAWCRGWRISPATASRPRSGTR